MNYELLKMELEELGIDYDVFDDLQLDELQLGLENEVDISIYAKPEFNSYQMTQIRGGLEAGIDVSKYANPEYNWEEMCEIRRRILGD